MSRAAEQRVETFLRHVERIRIEELLAFAAAHPRAGDIRELDEAAARTGQTAAVRRLRDDVEDYVRRASSGLGPIGPLGVQMNSSALSGPDLGRLVGALGTAAAALLLADQLDDAVVGRLVGSFGGLAPE